MFAVCEDRHEERKSHCFGKLQCRMAAATAASFRRRTSPEHAFIHANRRRGSAGGVLSNGWRSKDFAGNPVLAGFGMRRDIAVNADVCRQQRIQKNGRVAGRYGCRSSGWRCKRQSLFATARAVAGGLWQDRTLLMVACRNCDGVSVGVQGMIRSDNRLTIFEEVMPAGFCLSIPAGRSKENHTQQADGKSRAEHP